MAAKAIPKVVRDTVYARADGRCEGCGKFAPTELHHRRFRGRGGKHTISNLVALCGWGNHTGCHGRAHGPNAPAGWAISQHEKRRDVHVAFDSFEGLVHLTDAGHRDPAHTDPPF